MTIRIRSSQDFGSGIFFTLFGAGVLLLGRGYAVGNVSQMGPGFFPLVLSLATIGVGILLLFRGLSVDGPRIANTAWLTQIYVVASVIVFGSLIERAGLVVSVVAMVLVTSFAYKKLRWHETFALAIFLALFAVVIFVYLLGQPLSIWGTWWTS